MLISAGGSSGGRGLVSASGIDSPPSPSPPPAVRHSPRPRLPPPLSAESRASPPLWAAGAASGAADPSAARRHPAGFNGGLHAAEPPPPLRLPCSSLRPAAAAPSRARARGAPLPRRRLSAAHPQPRSPRAAFASVAISQAASPGLALDCSQRSGRVRPRGGILPALATASRRRVTPFSTTSCRPAPTRRRSASRKKQPFQLRPLKNLHVERRGDVAQRNDFCQV